MKGEMGVRIDADAMEQAIREEQPQMSNHGLRNEALLDEVEGSVKELERVRKITLNKADRTAMVNRLYNHFSGSLKADCANR